MQVDLLLNQIDTKWKKSQMAMTNALLSISESDRDCDAFSLEIKNHAKGKEETRCG